LILYRKFLVVIEKRITSEMDDPLDPFVKDQNNQNFSFNNNNGSVSNNSFEKNDEVKDLNRTSYFLRVSHNSNQITTYPAEESKEEEKRDKIGVFNNEIMYVDNDNVSNKTSGFKNNHHHEGGIKNEQNIEVSNKILIDQVPAEQVNNFLYKIIEIFTINFFAGGCGVV
jgi:hypothetical protein